MGQRAIAARTPLRSAGRGGRTKRRPRGRTAIRSRLATSSRRAIALCALGAALVAGYFLWLRDSTLVAVEEVQVSGLSGPEEPEISAALEAAAQEMTTLHVQLDELAAAVREYPSVESLRISTSFPHGLEITVVERRPVAVVTVGSTEVAVAADGTLLPAAVTDELELPVLDASPAEGAGGLEDEGVEQATVLGATPEPLRRVAESASNGSEGVSVTLEGGIELRFGDASHAAAKWAAAARILADPELTSLTYIDLTTPERPAVGGAPPAPAEIVPPADAPPPLPSG